MTVVFCPMPGSTPFGFRGFAFFFGDFGAELDVFFVFDRAAGFFAFGFFPVFGFFGGFGFFAFFGGRSGEVAREGGQTECLRRGGGGQQREQQQDQQEGEKELGHRSFIGTATGLL